MNGPSLGVAPEWQERGLCRQVDPDLFYPERGYSPEDAKAICRRCDVRAECLRYALDRNEQHGVWGGKTEKERRALNRAPRGASIHPIRQRQRSGVGDHHKTIAAMLGQATPATWAEIGAAIGFSGSATKKYWLRQKRAAAQLEAAA